MDWKRVKWSEASQILSALDWDEDPEIGAASARPCEYFEGLRRAERFGEAVCFLAQALPRLEAVAWAARSVRDIPDGGARKGPEAAALKAALLWVQDTTSDARRRAAYDAAMTADSSSPEALAALAAFFSGGSLGPAEHQAIPPPKDAAGRFAAGAVLKAAARSPDMVAALNSCLDAGELLAQEGLRAGAAA